MSALAFTILRLGYLVLLWFFLYLIVRVMRRDMADSPVAGPSRRRSAGGSEQPSGPPPRGRRRSATRLVITEGPLAGSTVPLSPSLVLDDSYASSRHARVFPKDGAWWLEDLGSTNGTMMDGRPVHGAVELPMNIPVRIGQTTLELRS